MGKLENLIIKGKIGDFVFYELYGKQIIRRLPGKVKNPRTIKQTRNRSQFGCISKMATNALHSLIHPYWNSVAKKKNKSGYSFFIKTNMEYLRNGSVSNDRLILCPKSGLNQEEFITEVIQSKLCLRWKTDNFFGGTREKDELILISLTNEYDLKLYETNCFREDQYFEFDIGDAYPQSIFTFWRNGKRWSESKFVFSFEA